MLNFLSRCAKWKCLLPLKHELKWTFRQKCFFYRTINSSTASTELLKIRDNFLQYTGGAVLVHCNDETGIAELCFSHPEKKNALTGSMMVQFADIVSRLENWSTGKGVILYSTGNIFCSGADLDMVKQIGTSQLGHDLATLMHNTLERFLRLPLISVTLIQGDAMGGGAELATATDFRLIASGAHIQFLQAKLGVVTGWGGGTRLVHLLGPSKALHLLTSCQKVSAQEAFDIGLTSAILKPETDLLSKAQEWLLDLTKPSSQVVRAMKTIVSTASSRPVTESLLVEKQLFASLWGGPAQKAALQKFVKHK